MGTRDRSDAVPGADATTPKEIPKRGWFAILRRGFKEMGRDQMSLIAAGVAFYTFLSIVPTLIAATLIYGLVTDPSQVQKQISDLGDALPESARQLVTEQMTSLASGQPRGLGIATIVALALALWSASGGVGNLITAVNMAYDEDETRGFVKRKALSLGLTLAGIVFFIVAVSLVAVFPAVANALDLATPLRIAAEVARWVVLLALVTVSLAVLYRVAPDRDAPRLSWVTTGSVVATVLWVVAAVGFSIYVSTFGSYNKTYGSLAGIVVLLMWLWISIWVVLLGAEINAESEQQTVRDTTKGEERPLGQRRAVKADSLPDGTHADAGGNVDLREQERQRSNR